MQVLLSLESLIFTFSRLLCSLAGKVGGRIGNSSRKQGGRPGHLREKVGIFSRRLLPALRQDVRISVRRSGGVTGQLGQSAQRWHTLCQRCAARPPDGAAGGLLALQSILRSLEERA